MRVALGSKKSSRGCVKASREGVFDEVGVSDWVVTGGTALNWLKVSRVREVAVETLAVLGREIGGVGGGKSW